jgi:hypothetical protein
VCNVLKCPSCLLLADMNVFRAIEISRDCSLHQTDIDCICSWPTTNHMKVNVSKTKVVYFTRKTDAIPFEHKFCVSCINRTDTGKYLGIMLDSKLHVDYTFTGSEVIGFYSCYNFLFHLYFVLARSELQYASVARTAPTSTGTNELEHIQRKFLVLCYNRFCPQIYYS